MLPRDGTEHAQVVQIFMPQASGATPATNGAASGTNGQKPAVPAGSELALTEGGVADALLQRLLQRMHAAEVDLKGEQPPAAAWGLAGLTNRNHLHCYVSKSDVNMLQNCGVAHTLPSHYFLK